MHNNWAEVRMQMDQVLETERELAEARRQQRRKRSLLQTLLKWPFHWLSIGQPRAQSTRSAELAAETQR